MLKSLLMASALTMAFSGTAIANTTLDIGTGYDNANYSLYPVPSGTGGGVNDGYWIKIASYEPSNVTIPVAPAVVVNGVAAGWLPIPNVGTPTSSWVSPRSGSASAAGVTPNNRSWSLFRKCFCLTAGYKNPSLKFTVRGDDNISVYFNTNLNTLVNPVTGQWSWGSGVPVSTTNGFKQGKNCLFVMVEDAGGRTGFNLSGAASAQGLLPMAANGIPQSYDPCQCKEPGQPGVAAKATLALPQEMRSRGVTAQSMEEAEAIVGLIALAEKRRLDPSLKIESAPGQ